MDVVQIGLFYDELKFHFKLSPQCAVPMQLKNSVTFISSSAIASKMYNRS